MISKRTVLVLGAGASMGYKFPSGDQLLQRIHADCLNPGTNKLFDTALGYLEISHKRAKELAALIEATPSRSIDALLEHQPAYMNVGKLAIAVNLLPLENQNVLNDVRKRSESWYQYLWDCIQAPKFEQLCENGITFVTYNYDRSLDFFIRSSIKALYGKSESDIDFIMQYFPIIHLHGALGSLKKIPFSCDVSKLFIPDFQYIIESIRVIHESNQNADGFMAAKVALRKAQQAVFLGFGYHEVNLDRLLDSDHSHLKFLGTAFNFTDKEIDLVAKRLPGEAVLEDMEILEFLRETCVLVG